MGFALAFGGKFVRAWIFLSGDDVEAIIHRSGFVLPDRAQVTFEGRFGTET